MLGENLYMEKACPWSSNIEILDKAIAHSDWLAFYPEAVITHMPFSCFDHCYISLDAQRATIRVKGHSSSMKTHWSKYDKVKQLFSNKFKIQTSNSLMFQAIRKLKAVKKELRCWSKNVFGNFQSKVEANNSKL